MITFLDGDAWCAIEEGFVNIMESSTGWGSTPQEAAQALIDELETLCICGNNGGGDCDICQRISDVRREMEEQLK